MKFLVDNALSPQISEQLKARGHDSVHVRDLGLQAAEDNVVMARANLSAVREAAEEGSIIVFDEARIRIRRLPIGESD